MRYCPNRDCRYALEHHAAQEYRDEIQLCADCGAALVDTCPDWAGQPFASERRSPPWGRIALSLLAPPAAFWICPRLTLPGLDDDVIQREFPWLVESGMLSVFALSLMPFFSAFWIVELAALSVPRWRSLRTGGPSGRGRLLTASWRLALGLAAVQALSAALWLERMGVLRRDTRVSRLLVVFSLVAGTCALGVLARGLDQAGLGGGFSLLVVAFGLGQIFLPEAGVLKLLSGEGLTNPSALLLVCAGSVLLLRWRRRDAEGRVSAIRLPACGVVPVRQASAILAIVGSLAGLGLYPETLSTLGTAGSRRTLVLHLALTSVFAIGFGILFNRSSKVASHAHTEESDPLTRLEHAKAELWWAVTRSTAYVLGLSGIQWLIEGQLQAERPVFDVALLVAGVAVVLDVVAEAEAFRRHGDLVPVWPEHRLYAVDGALAALDRSGIPCFARSAYHRALWHFFAPFIPIQILVPAGRTEEATRVLVEHFSRTAGLPTQSVA